MAALSSNKAAQALKSDFDSMAKNLKMSKLFAADPHRFEKFHRTLKTPDGELLFDFSKNIVTDEIFTRLIEIVGL